MPARLVVVLALVSMTLLGASPRVRAAESAASQYPQVVPVTKTFDNRAFSYRIESVAEKNGYVLYRLSYPSPVTTSLKQNNTVPAEYYVPRGMKPTDPKRPAVICMHILDGNMELVRMTCTVLATHGIPAILFKLPYYGERGPAEGPRVLENNPRLFVSALTQGMQDMRRTVDVLSSRPELDPSRIGITGISLGGIVAGTAAGIEPRISRTMMVLAGGDLLAIIHHARETRELSNLIKSLPEDEQDKIDKAIQSVDPLRFAPRLRDRAQRGKVLMVNAAEDEVIPRACTEKLAEALGIKDRVEWLDGLGHYTAMASLPQVLQQTVGFFAQDLPPGLKVTEPPADTTPTQTVLNLVKQALDFLLAEPLTGKCHFADVAVSVTPAGQKTYDGRLLFIRGWQGRFKLQCRLPVIGEVAVGQGNYPWIASTQKTLFKGTKNATGKPGDPLAFVDPQHLLRVRMLAGGVAGASLAPDILDPLVAIQQGPMVDEHRSILASLKGRNRGSMQLLLKPDGKTPHLLAFDVPGARGVLTFRAWQMNTATPEEAFDPPTGYVEKEVEPAAVQRIFSALFNFALENLE